MMLSLRLRMQNRKCDSGFGKSGLDFAPAEAHDLGRASIVSLRSVMELRLPRVSHVNNVVCMTAQSRRTSTLAHMALTHITSLSNVRSDRTIDQRLLVFWN